MVRQGSPRGRALLAGRALLRPRLAALLGAEGYEVVEAADAAAARAALSRGPVVVALLDAGMPEPGGLGLLAEIRHESRQPPAILFTEEFSVGTALAAEAQGADGYLTLLLDDADLRLALRRVLPQRPARPRPVAELQTLGRVACGVVHDLNNLLTAIRGHSELLLIGVPADDPWRESLEAINQVADKASLLTRQLLGLCKNRRVRPEVQDLNATITELGPMLKSVVSDRVELSLALEPGAGAIYLEPGQVERVLLNLALNACDAMPSGGRLMVETVAVYLDEPADWRMAVAPGWYAMLTVRDTGTGLDPATRTHLFEPFFTTKEQQGGSGLGLAIVWEIVQAGGGTLQVESEPGHGTTFRICFPQAPVAVVSPAVAS
jgi:signal transduction histidine kinase